MVKILSFHNFHSKMHSVGQRPRRRRIKPLLFLSISFSSLDRSQNHLFCQNLYQPRQSGKRNIRSEIWQPMLFIRLILFSFSFFFFFFKYVCDSFSNWSLNFRYMTICELLKILNWETFGIHMERKNNYFWIDDAPSGDLESNHLNRALDSTIVWSRNKSNTTYNKNGSERDERIKKFSRFSI